MVDIERDYQKALDYLYSFVDYSLTRNLSHSTAKFDLRRMVDLMHLLGDPQTKYPTIHVAGSKGKGSTCALITSALVEAGYRVGFYSSPHLTDFTERIQVNDKNISHVEIVKHVEKIRPFVNQIKKLTTFEITTAIAFQYFEEEKVDIAVIEVGLGGRLDATNIITPIASVMTSLSLDHMAVLGDTLDKIAGEKAGIIKENIPVISAQQNPEALKVLQEKATQTHSDFYLVGEDIIYSLGEHSLQRQQFSINIDEKSKSKNKLNMQNMNISDKSLEFNIPLLGAHQVENAATAYMALKVIQRAGIVVTDKSIKRGFEKVNWPGRFEVLIQKPLFIIDSAHNRDSVKKLSKTIDDYLANRSIILIFGASEDKDIAGMFAELLPHVKKVIMTQSIHPRALDIKQLVNLTTGYNCTVEAIIPIENAIEQAISEAAPDDVILGTGSIFIAAAIREYVANSQKKLKDQ
jgi:dihydrofolate synthase/folylpolyglutamate synthase